MTVEPDHSDTRARILSEAERLFRHYGYAKTTIADIADACQMSPANLYRFFSSKSALIEAICGKISAEAEYRLLDIVRSEAPATERLKRFIQQVHKHTVENLLDHRKVHELVVVAMEEQWHAIKAHLDRVRFYLQQIIEDGIESGEFAKQDAAHAAKCVQASTAYLCHPVIVAQKLDDEDRVMPDEMVQFIVTALKGQA